MEDYFIPYKTLAEKWGVPFGASSITELLFICYANDPMLNNKFCYLKGEEMLFWAFDSYSTRFGMHQTYSGVYRWVKMSNPDFECHISERFMLDFLVGGKRDKLGISEIDSKVTLYTNDKKYAREVITSDLVERYRAFTKVLSPVEVVINPEYIPKFKGHEEEQLVGLETNRWYSTEELELYWERMREFINRIL